MCNVHWTIIFIYTYTYKRYPSNAITTNSGFVMIYQGLCVYIYMLSIHIAFFAGGANHNVDHIFQVMFSPQNENIIGKS